MVEKKTVTVPVAPQAKAKKDIKVEIARLKESGHTIVYSTFFKMIDDYFNG